MHASRVSVPASSTLDVTHQDYLQRIKLAAHVLVANNVLGPEIILCGDSVALYFSTAFRVLGEDVCEVTCAKRSSCFEIIFIRFGWDKIILFHIERAFIRMCCHIVSFYSGIVRCPYSFCLWVCPCWLFNTDNAIHGRSICIM